MGKSCRDDCFVFSLVALIQPVVTYQTAADLGDFIPITASTSGSLFPKQQNAMASLGMDFQCKCLAFVFAMH